MTPVTVKSRTYGTFGLGVPCGWDCSCCFPQTPIVCLPELFTEDPLTYGKEGRMSIVGTERHLGQALACG